MSVDEKENAANNKKKIKRTNDTHTHESIYNQVK